MVHPTHCVAVHYFVYKPNTAISAFDLTGVLSAYVNHDQRHKLHVRPWEDIHTCFPEQEYTSKNVSQTGAFYERGQTPINKLVVAVEGHKITLDCCGGMSIYEKMDIDLLGAASKYLGLSNTPYCLFMNIFKT